MENILTLLTSEDKNEIRTAVKEIIIEQVKNDFDGYDLYLFDPSQIEEMMEEIIDEIKEEVKSTYKEKLMKEMEKKLNSIL